MSVSGTVLNVASITIEISMLQETFWP